MANGFDPFASLAIAKAFVASGARAHIADVNAEAMQEITKQYPATSGTMGDISKPVDLDALFHNVQKQLGCLDVLVNNAGIAGHSVPEIQEKDPSP